MLAYLCILWIATSAAGAASWSDWTNAYEGALNYSCPNNEAVAGVSSEFSTLHGDRRWKFYCSDVETLAGAGDVSCALQTASSTPGDDVDFSCPSSAYLGGVVAEFDSTTKDRVWRAYCCSRRRASLVDCDSMPIAPGTRLESAFDLPIPVDATNSCRRVFVGFEGYYDDSKTDRTWRFRHCELKVTCLAPEIPDNGFYVADSYLFNSTVNYACNRSFFMSNGSASRTCLNSGDYDGQEPTCSACTHIGHCADVRCTNETDQHCVLCESNHGFRKGDRAFVNRRTTCDALCSWKSHYCYPGNCTGTIDTCQCSPDFAGPSCLQLNAEPTLLDCRVRLENSNGVETADAACNSSSSPLPVYTNVLPTDIRLEWDIMYHGPNPPPPRPSYVIDYAVGVAESYTNATIRRASALSVIVDAEIFDCITRSFSDASPVAGPAKCVNEQPLLKTFLHGDRYEMTVASRTGGRVTIRNHDAATNETKFYDGASFVGRALFILDFVAPTHCSTDSPPSCQSGEGDSLKILAPITRRPAARLRWGGYGDDLADVASYRVDAYRLELRGARMCEIVDSPIDTHSVEHSTSILTHAHEFDLDAPGVYSVVLTTIDGAGNRRLARRFVLYDADSTLRIDVASPIRVTTAENSTREAWQTNLRDPISIRGVGHFYNTRLRVEPWLSPICDFYRDGGGVDAAYDQPAIGGDLPRNGTINADGVVVMEYAIRVDDEAGESAASVAVPTVWTAIDDLALENFTAFVARRDGETARFWFRATDVFGVEAIDSIVLHFDSSPPVVGNFTFAEKGDVADEPLHLYDSSDVSKMVFDFNAKDEESGIEKLTWTIGSYSGGSDVASGRVQIRSSGVCNDDDSCYCISIGLCYNVTFRVRPNSLQLKALSLRHDSEYHVAVTAINRAGLALTIDRRFTVDTTPPRAGYVVDGVQGSDDVDFQSSRIYSFAWSGFFDHETGIAFYQYIVDSECAKAETFSVPPVGKVNQTRETWASLATPSGGFYRVTVVAYNRALTMSQTVCSDGVVIDETAPIVEQVHIDDIRVEPGLGRNSQNEVWLVNKNRLRKRVESPSLACLANVPLVHNLPLYPLDSQSPTAESDACTRYPPLIEEFFLNRDGAIAANWSASDPESDLLDYEFGLSSTSNQTAYPDIYPFASTGARPAFVVQHANIRQGERIYVVIRAKNNAALSSTVVVGSIRIDTTPPTFVGDLQVKFDNDSRCLVATWPDDGGFVDPEDDRLRLEIAVKANDETVYNLDFRTVDVVATVCVDELAFPLHDAHVYVVHLRATNRAGLSSFVASNAYAHDDGSPIGKIVVVDLDPSPPRDDCSNPSERLFLLDEDADFQTIGDRISARWFGGGDVTYEFGVGSKRYSDDVVAFKSIGNATRHTELGLALEHNRMYYVIIRASRAANAVVASSDGVRVFTNADGWMAGSRIVDGLRSVDRDYQASLTTLEAAWTFPASLDGVATHFAISALKRTGNSTETIRACENVGTRKSATLAGLSLTMGSDYFVEVRPCRPGGCFGAVVSDGVRVLDRPVARRATATYDVLTRRLDVAWAPFDGEDVVCYRYHVGTESGWSNTLSISDCTISLGHQANVTLFAHYRYFVTVIGVNAAGLSDRAFVEVSWKNGDRSLVRSNVANYTLNVYDVDPDRIVASDPTLPWEQREFVDVAYDDLEYVRRTTRLAAAWPRYRRHASYRWSVSTISSFASCDSDGVVACGTTTASDVVVDDLRLALGRRYYVCVRAEAANVARENFVETLESFEACSNGVVVDWKEPELGCVRLGGEEIDDCDDGRRTVYQASSSHFSVFWSGFADNETGINYYEYAIGSSVGLGDVANYTSVGSQTSVTLNGLSLRDGQMYYATVRAYDFAGNSIRAISNGVVVDSSPPSLGLITIADNPFASTNHLPSLSDGLTAHWSGINDEESGLAALEWTIGSRPGDADIAGFSAVAVGGTFSAKADKLNDVRQSQLVFASIVAVNRAGLSRLSTSNGCVADRQSPAPGRVLDGDRVAVDSDVDYVQSAERVSAHWTAFDDGETFISEYLWSLGSCLKCADVVPLTSSGLQTEAFLSSLHLVNGRKYFASVVACDGVGLCSEPTSSDGFVVDVSPPVSGVVFDGTRTGNDIDFQSNRNFLSAQWYGFHDSQSSIYRFDWAVGTGVVLDDILPWRVVHLSQTATASLSTPLPLNANLYSSVRAVNRAGLETISTSNGFRVDVTPPLVRRRPAIDVAWAGSLKVGSQYDRTRLRVDWKFDDAESPIVSRHVSVSASHDGATQLPASANNDDGDEYVATGLTLEDGHRYAATVTACNAAGLCVVGSSDYALVDSSRPSAGAFAVETESVAELNRDVGSMTWINDDVDTKARLDLAWLGFDDPHSGIDHYYVDVGTGYASADLAKGARVAHAGATTATQRTIVLTSRRLFPNEKIIATIWAVNGVGVRSEYLKRTFVVRRGSASGSGDLELERSVACSVHRCAGHCTCAPLGRRCAPTTTCRPLNATDASRDRSIVVSTTETNFTSSQCCLGASWSLVGSGDDIVGFEWSVGVVGKSIVESTWFDVGSEKSAVFLVENERNLSPGVSYVFHVRTWYSADEYAVFRSDAVVVDRPHSPIATTGRRVKEIRSLTATRHDVDFTNSTSQIVADWKNVFEDDSFSGITRYEIGIGTNRGTSDIYSFSSVGVATTILLSGLSLDSGRKYFTTVRAVNGVGLYSISTSDGITIDVERPRSGLVIDGRGPHDASAQTRVDRFDARWSGFVDLDSYVSRYEWCVATHRIDSSPPDVMNFTDVGLALRGGAAGLDLAHGRTYYAGVVAVDATGLRSDVVWSDGCVVDSTRPRAYECVRRSANLVVNPSFESSPPCGTVDDIVAGWSVNETTTRRQAVEGRTGAHDDCTTLFFVGAVSQSIATTPGVKYRVAMDLDLGGRVDISPGGMSRTFSARERRHGSNDAVSSEENAVLYFTAQSMTSLLTIRTIDERVGTSVDNVVVDFCEMRNATPTKDDNATVLHDSPSITIGSRRRNFIGSTPTTIYVNWDIKDAESGIDEYAWAIGTVAGGQQLQPYTSVGQRENAESKRVAVASGTSLFVTVVARNRAGLERVVRSRPFALDVTPPVGGVVLDGGRNDVDVDYQRSTIISADWSSFVDDESGIESCQWAIGTSPGANDLQDYVVVRPPLFNASNAGLGLRDGERVYVRVECVNGAGLRSAATSDGVTIVTIAPDSSSATLSAFPAESSSYEYLDGHTSDRSSVRLAWFGFDRPTRLSHYEIMLSGTRLAPPAPITWTNVGRVSGALLVGLALQDTKAYVARVRAVGVAGETSVVVEKRFTVDVIPPIDTGLDLNVTRSRSLLRLDWNGKFVARTTTPLRYELSVGTKSASTDVLQFVETSASDYAFGVPDSSADYYVSLTAVNGAGLHKTIVQHLPGLA